MEREVSEATLLAAIALGAVVALALGQFDWGIFATVVAALLSATLVWGAVYSVARRRDSGRS